MGSREILIRFIFKRFIFKSLDADVGKPEICARRTKELADGRASQALFKENYCLFYTISSNLI